MDEHLLPIIVRYLEEAGWYFDWPHVVNVWGEPKDDADRAEFLRTYHGWTVPQWGDYWMAPYSGDPTHANFGKPKRRRYESLQEAIWSQVLREEKPEDFAIFFQEREAKV